MERLCVFLMIGFFAAMDGAQNQTSPAPPQSPSYLISVPKVLHSGVHPTVSITILTKSSVLVVSEMIQGNNSLGQVKSTIKGGSTKLQVLPPIPEKDSSYRLLYKLVVKGYIGPELVFSNSTVLQYSPKSVSILLQTDKPKYKPGQEVKIRALVITPDSKPSNKQINISIMDPRENLIHQWLAVDTVLGETAKEFQLSQNPPLGTWKIQATVNTVTQEKVFTVNHYVLPKFEVLIDAPEILYYEQKLTYNVTAQYLYGKPVSGRMLIVYVHSLQGIPTSTEDWKMIDGKAELSFDVPSLYQTKPSSDYMYLFYEFDHIEITVQVTELLTGNVYNNTVGVPVALYRYNLEFQQYPSTLKPSLTFLAQLKLSTYNNHPLSAEDQSRSLTLTVTQQQFSPWMFIRGKTSDFVPNNSSFLPYPNVNSSVASFELPVPADGVIPFQIELSENIAMLSLEAQYEDVQKSLHLYRTYSSPSTSYIQLRHQSSPQIGQSFSMTVESNFHLTLFHYMVISRGQVVAAGTWTSADFSLSPDPSWVPLAYVLVYCVLPDGEIVNDVMELSFPETLQNHVSVSWATEHAEPAENVSLSVSVTEPRSLVGILVVDKASQDMDRSNDFTEKRVMEELATYTKDKFLTDAVEISDPYSAFLVTGITVLTDASLPAQNSYAKPEFREEFPVLFTLDKTEEAPQQRKNFPETWLWFDTNLGESTSADFTVTVPDSMTSWVATAFVISENLGLGLSAPAEIHVSKGFFLSLNLPAYLVRGELLLLEVTLFNYLDLDIEVLVTVDASSMFEFVTSAGDESLLESIRDVSVSSQSSSVVIYAIRATQLGQMPISVKASSLYASDSVLQTILVKPEGMEQSSTQTLFLEFDLNQASLSRGVEFQFPAAAVPGSLRAQVTAVGDILGPSISGLDSLIQMPYGCGEQNMIYFAPNVYVLQYLSNLDIKNEELSVKALDFMTQGYERELSYQRTDGSFSAFGESDLSGSTWLSSFVLRCFLKAQQFIYIDKAVLSRATKWLLDQQKADGSFAEPGRVIHTELQGGLDGSVALTAYVLMALLEDRDLKQTNGSAVSAAMSYLTSRLHQGISSNYSLCLVTYALCLGESPSARMALAELMNRAQMHDGVPTWSAGRGVSETWQPRSADIEMASYTLLSLYKWGSIEQALKIMKWLCQQRSHLGGYGSTQDTVIALQALSSFSSLSNKEHINLTITVISQTTSVATFVINRMNSLLYQSQEIEAENHLQLHVSAVGKGFALFQLTTFYNIEVQERARGLRSHMCETFYLKIQVMDDAMYNIHLNICFRLCEHQGLDQTGMAILDVGLLSGFILAQSGVQLNELVRKVETSPGKVILYLDSVSKEESCVEVPTTMDFIVTGVQDAVVKIYDYYEPTRYAEEMYTSETRRDIPFCSLCGQQCTQCGDLGVSVFDRVISSHCQQDLVQSMALLLLITFLFCF